VQLVEMKLPGVVDRLAADREQQPGVANPRALAVRTGVLDHHLVEPRFHFRAGFPALTVAAVVPLDPARDAAEADLLPFPVVAFDLRLGWRVQHDLFRVNPVEDGAARLLGKIAPRHVEREAARLREAEHDPAVPRLRVVFERLLHEAAAGNAPLRVGDEQLGVRELVHAEAAARPARALGVVEHEEFRRDVAVREVMSRTAQPAIEFFRLRFTRLGDVDLQEPIADEQRGGDARLDRFLVLPADHESIHDAVHVLDRRLVELDLVGDVDCLAVDDQPPAALLAHFGEDDVQVFAVDLEDRRAQLDLRAFRQREDRLEDLARGPARRGLAGARAVRLTDRREQQVQIAGNVGHRADGRARVVGQRLLLDRDDRRKAEDEVHVGLGHLGEEPLGVARQRLHVAPLPLRVDRVERQAGLARAGESRHDDQAVARDFQRDVLQVVHARALHGDGGPCSGFSTLGIRHVLSRCRGARQPPTTNSQLPKCLGVEVAATFTQLVRTGYLGSWELAVGL
jgi:hypothetical protein